MKSQMLSKQEIDIIKFKTQNIIEHGEIKWKALFISQKLIITLRLLIITIKIQSSSGWIYMMLGANLFHILQTLLMTKMENQFWIQRQLQIDLMITLLLYIKKVNSSQRGEPFDAHMLNDYVTQEVPEETKFSISQVKESFVLNQLQKLTVNKATGIDDISAKYLKLAAPGIANTLTKFFNLSIQNGTFPDILKKVKVTPIFNYGNKADVNNFRLISVLPVLTSIFERLVSNCMTSFWEKYNLIYELQSGFRRLHSCQTALTKVVDNWLTALNSNQIVWTVVLDLSKAFDLINHEILIKKRITYKFNESTISWFKTYISIRFQQVHIPHLRKAITTRRVKAGVPQGSVLGPLLFLIYVNDLPLSLQFCTLDLFADDATLSSSDSSICILTHNLNEDLINFKDWCNNNSMLLNVSKTKAMYVSSRYKVNQIMSDPPLLKIDNETIELSTSENFLGVHIDNTLS